MNTNNWTDFNDAEAQQGGFNLIPKGTLVPVRMTIRPGVMTITARDGLMAMPRSRLTAALCTCPASLSSLRVNSPSASCGQT